MRKNIFAGISQRDPGAVGSKKKRCSVLKKQRHNIKTIRIKQNLTNGNA